MHSIHRSHPAEPLLLGHRGAPRLAAENTLDSYRAALAAGLDGLEIDLQLTSDGVLAVYHDPDIGGRPLIELEWEELRELAPATPRFEEVMELMASHDGRYLNIELKSAGLKRDGRERALAAALADWDEPAAGRSWISCFDPLSLIGLKRLGVELPLALLVATPEPLELLPCLPATGVHPHHALVTPERMAAWRQRDLFVYAWTVNEQPLAEELLRAGVDGLIGDLPDALLGARAAGSR